MNNVFASIPIHFPPLAEQKSITNTLNTAEREIALLKQITKQYRTKKRALLQKLLTGKWRLRSQ